MSRHHMAQKPVVLELPWLVWILPAQETRYTLCSGTWPMCKKPTLFSSTNKFTNISSFGSELKKKKIENLHAQVGNANFFN